MSDEKPIFKCIKTRNGSKNNWYDNLMKFTEQHEADIAKLEEKGMITDISGRHCVTASLILEEEKINTNIAKEAIPMIKKIKEA